MRKILLLPFIFILHCETTKSTSNELTINELEMMLKKQFETQKRPEGLFILKHQLNRESNCHQLKFLTDSTRTLFVPKIWVIPATDSVKQKAQELEGKSVKAIIEIPEQVPCLVVCICDPKITLKSIELK